MRLKQLCTRKVRDFAMALRARKLSGAFEKRAPAPKKKITSCRIITDLSIVVLDVSANKNMNSLRINVWSEVITFHKAKSFQFKRMLTDLKNIYHCLLVDSSPSKNGCHQVSETF